MLGTRARNADRRARRASARRQPIASEAVATNCPIYPRRSPAGRCTTGLATSQFQTRIRTVRSEVTAREARRLGFRVGALRKTSPHKQTRRSLNGQLQVVTAMGVPQAFAVGYQRSQAQTPRRMEATLITLDRRRPYVTCRVWARAREAGPYARSFDAPARGHIRASATADTGMFTTEKL